MLIRFANSAGLLELPAGRILPFALPGNPFFPDYYYRLSNLYSGPTIDDKYARGILIGEIVVSAEEESLYNDPNTRLSLFFSYPEGIWPFLKIYYSTTFPYDDGELNEANSILVTEGASLPLPSLSDWPPNEMTGIFYFDVVVDKVAMLSMRPDWAASQNAWIYHGFIASPFRFVILNGSTELAQSPSLTIRYWVPKPHEENIALLLTASSEPTEVPIGGGGSGGGGWTIGGGTGQFTGGDSPSPDVDPFPPCDPPLDDVADPLEEQLVGFSFEHGEGGYNWSVTYTYEGASSAVASALDNLRTIGRNATNGGLSMGAIVRFLPGTLGAQLGAVASFPAGYVEYEEVQQYNTLDGTVAISEFTISGGLSTAELLERKLTYIPNLRPFDPVGLAISASKEGKICLEDYLRLRMSDQRPSLGDVLSAIEALDIARFFVSAPRGDKIPYADVPPKEEASSFDGIAPLEEIFSDLIPWIPYKAFIRPEGGKLKLFILDGTMSAGSFDLGSWQHAKATTTISPLRPIEKIKVSTGPVPDIFEGPIDDTPPPDEPPPGEGDDSEECASKSCVYYTYDVSSNVTTITKIVKQCNRIIREERTTYASVVIRPGGVDGDSLFASCTRVAVTREITTYDYVSFNCDLVARRIRRVLYEPAIITDVPDWLFEPDNTSNPNLWSICHQLSAYVTAELEYTTYEYDSKGCLRKETTTGYRLRDMAIDFDSVSYSINGNPILPPPLFSFEPIYSQNIYVHFGKGEWLASERVLSTNPTTAWGVIGYGFNPVVAMALANRPFYGRTTITNEAPPCRECGAQSGRQDGDEEQRAPCKLGEVTSASYGLTTLDFDVTYGSTGDSESITVPEINQYLIWTEELERISRQSGALGMGSSTSTPDPCVGPLRRDATVIKDTIEEMFPSLTKPDAESIRNELKLKARVYADYVAGLRRFGNRRVALDYTGATPDVLPLGGMGVALGDVEYIVMRSSLRLSIERVASGLIKRRYDISMDLWEKVS